MRLRIPVLQAGRFASKAAPWLLVALFARHAPAGISSGKGLRPVTTADSVLAIYAEDYGLASSGSPRPILLVWDDGRVVWSLDQLNGGPPYRTGRADPRRLAKLFSRLERDGAFGDPDLKRAWVGPDAKFTTMLVKSRQHHLRLQSWHEQAEADGLAVASSAGIEPLAGRRRLDVLRKESTSYLYFRFVWAEIRASAARLIPPDSVSTKGEALMKADVLSWNEE